MICKICGCEDQTTDPMAYTHAHAAKHIAELVRRAKEAKAENIHTAVHTSRIS